MDYKFVFFNRLKDVKSAIMKVIWILTFMSFWL